MKNFMQSLNEDQASHVLEALLTETPELMKKAYDIAMKVVGDVDADSIMDDVFCELDSLDVDVLSGRSGRTMDGYVDPADESWVMFEEALYPFIREMKKNQQRALPAAAKAYCIGIIKGIWRYAEESVSDFAEWVIDAPGEYIYTVVEEWKKGNPSSEDIVEVTNIVEGGQS
jgi:hypothetical protein